MKNVGKLHRWIIKEKHIGEIPLGTDPKLKYAIFAPDGRWMEDNLTWQQAVDFCEENKNEFTGGLTHD